MAITFHPKAGMVLMCDFVGYIAPEMVKTRPVVIVSPSHLERSGLYTVVPMSATAPNNPQPYHLKLANNPLPKGAPEVWVKCDMVATVGVQRLDRVKVSRGIYKVCQVTPEELAAIRECLKYVIGIT
jgi:mRNA interferase MazF